MGCVGLGNLDEEFVLSYHRCCLFSLLSLLCHLYNRSLYGISLTFMLHCCDRSAKTGNDWRMARGRPAASAESGRRALSGIAGPMVVRQL